MNRTCLFSLLIVGLLSAVITGCSSDDDGKAAAPAPSQPSSPPAVVEEAPAVADAVADVADSDAIEADWTVALTAVGRSAQDQDADAARKPIEVVGFLDIEPGMTVLDLIAAGGYYTEVLAAAVGREGKVYSHNTEFILTMREGKNEKTISARLADDRLPNVERWDREFGQLGMSNQVDAAMLSLNLHDVYNYQGKDTALAFLKDIAVALKPGGVLGVIDHAGISGVDNKELHRIEQVLAEQLLVESGFVIEAQSDLLANADDTHTVGVFDPAMRRQTDRFLIRARNSSE